MLERYSVMSNVAALQDWMFEKVLINGMTVTTLRVLPCRLLPVPLMESNSHASP